MSGIRRHLSYANATATLALVFALSGGAYAALAPVDNGVIHTCFRRSTGALRVVNASARCSRRERALNFNQRGPIGPRGPVGPRGATGKTGAAGKTGATGKTGANGTSVTSTALSVGSTACPAGGASFTSASGTTAACNGTAVAYASVNVSGTLATSRNVTDDSAVATGIYCFKLGVTPAVGVASVRGDAGSVGFAQVLIPAGSACTASGDTTAEVLTFGMSGAGADLPFDVMFN